MTRLYTLFKVICILESGMNCAIINMKSKAYGPAQIRQCVLTDVNEAEGTTYQLHQMRRMDTSFYVFRLYLKRHKLLAAGQGLITHKEATRIIRAWRNGPYASEDHHPNYTERALNLLRSANDL